MDSGFCHHLLPARSQLVNDFFCGALTDLRMKCSIKTLFSQKTLPACLVSMNIAAAAFFFLRDCQITSFGDHQAQQRVLIIPPTASQASPLRPVASFAQTPPTPLMVLSPRRIAPRSELKPPPQPRHSPPLAPARALLPLLPCGAFQ